MLVLAGKVITDSGSALLRSNSSCGHLTKTYFKVRPDYTWMEYLLPNFCIKLTIFIPKIPVVLRPEILETACDPLETQVRIIQVFLCLSPFTANHEYTTVCSSSHWYFGLFLCFCLWSRQPLTPSHFTRTLEYQGWCTTLTKHCLTDPYYYTGI